MTKRIYDEDHDPTGVLRDGQSLRVPLMMMGRQRQGDARQVAAGVLRRARLGPGPQGLYQRLRGLEMLTRFGEVDEDRRLAQLQRALDGRVVQSELGTPYRAGDRTALPTFELGLETLRTGIDTAGGGFARMYGSFLSWRDPHTPVPKEIVPQLAFDRHEVNQ